MIEKPSRITYEPENIFVSYRCNISYHCSFAFGQDCFWVGRGDWGMGGAHVVELDCARGSWISWVSRNKAGEMSPLLFALAAVGFAASAYIFYKTQRKEKLFCLLGGECNDVVYSKYGKAFGIPNELAGMLYYVFLVVALFLSLESVARIAAILAFGASVYLLLIQAFVLKKWCEWCLATAVANIGIAWLLFF
ncbi:MAG: vitamin K epoxide reductase family protein [Candidatus Wildermuthbacteria bacterium]|nr:vitamin K epoxide reductase family protein [Candidatus Wildermuthbacteria bacterium]